MFLSGLPRWWWLSFRGSPFSDAGDVLEPEYFADLQAQLQELNLADRFHFAGGIKNLQEYLAGADIFVLPSRSEGFSNAIIEAMAASLPVVATAVGGKCGSGKRRGDRLSGPFRGLCGPGHSNPAAALRSGASRRNGCGRKGPGGRKIYHRSDDEPNHWSLRQAAGRYDAQTAGEICQIANGLILSGILACQSVSF